MRGLSRRHLFGAVCGGCLAVREGFRATPVQAQTGGAAIGTAAGPVVSGRGPCHGAAHAQDRSGGGSSQGRGGSPPGRAMSRSKAAQSARTLCLLK